MKKCESHRTKDYKYKDGSSLIAANHCYTKSEDRPARSAPSEIHDKRRSGEIITYTSIAAIGASPRFCVSQNIKIRHIICVFICGSHTVKSDIFVFETVINFLCKIM